LLDRVHVERAAGQLVHGGFEPLAFGRQLGGDRPEHVPVHRNTDNLHAGEYPHQRSLHAVEELLLADVGQGRLQRGAKSGQHGRQAHQSQSGVVETGRHGATVGLLGIGLEQEGTLALGPGAVVDGHTQEPGGEVGQPVAVVGRVEQVGGHRGVDDQAGDVDAEGQQRPHQFLDVVSHYTDAAGPEPVGQGVQDPSLGDQVAAAVGPQVDGWRRPVRRPLGRFGHQGERQQGRTPGIALPLRCKGHVAGPRLHGTEQGRQVSTGLVDVGGDGALGCVEPLGLLHGRSRIQHLDRSAGGSALGRGTEQPVFQG